MISINFFGKQHDKHLDRYSLSMTKESFRVCHLVAVKYIVDCWVFLYVVPVNSETPKWELPKNCLEWHFLRFSGVDTCKQKSLGTKSESANLVFVWTGPLVLSADHC